MKASELAEHLQMLMTVYGDLDVKLWPSSDQGNYRDCTVIVAGIDNKVFLIDEDNGSRDLSAGELDHQTDEFSCFC